MTAASDRRAAVEAVKRRAILDAARAVFAERGLARTTVRDIAATAGYVPGALYLYFPGKEAIYAALLEESLAALDGAVAAALTSAAAGEAAEAGFLAFHAHYRDNPNQLDLGLHLQQGDHQGLARRGLGPAIDRRLNARLLTVVWRLGAALQRDCDLDEASARQETAALLSLLVGCLVMEATGRLQLLGADGAAIAATGVHQALDRLRAGP